MSNWKLSIWGYWAIRSLKIAVVTASVWAFSLLPAWAHPELQNTLFFCRGKDYQGKVIVKKDGSDTYAVLWRIGKVSYAGTGFYENHLFCVAYVDQSGKHIGLAVYHKSGNQWVGRWTQLGAKQTTSEIWQQDAMPEPPKEDIQSQKSHPLGTSR